MNMDSKTDISTFLDEQVYPALFASLPNAFPEFGWTKQGQNWVATVWPSDFPVSSGKQRASRLMVYANATFWIKLHGKEGVRFLDYVNGGQKPVGSAFIEAVRGLAERAGVPFPSRAFDPVEEERNRKAAAKRAALKAVFQYCDGQLHGPHGTAALAYLTGKRGLSIDAIKTLGLGLYRSYVDAKDIVRLAGIDVTAREEVAGLFRKMQGYITYPWHDAAGRPLTIYGRWPGEPPEGSPKTMALPGEGTKSSPLYFDRARLAGHRELVLVEGVNDAATLQTLGDTRVIACVGSRLTREQVNTLVRHHVSSVTICLDPDGGGDDGTQACIKSLTQNGIRSYIAPRLPENVDPDEFVIKNGIDAWRQKIEAAEHSLRFMAKMLIGKHHAEVWIDRGIDACLDEAKAFVKAAEPKLSDLDTFFWPEFASSFAVGVDVVKARCGYTGAVPVVAPTSNSVANPSFPKGFEMSDAGLFFSPEAKGEGEPPKAIWVAAPFNICGEIADGAGGEWGLVLEWKDRSGHDHEWTLPRSMLHLEPRQIAATLENQGLKCSTASGHLREFLSRVNPQKILRSVEKAGWHRVDAEDSYAMADGTIFGPAVGTLMLKPESRRPGLECASQGSLADWQREIGQYAVGNSRLALFISASFVGPLLDIASEPSGGFHLIGKSQSGKSTATFAAASVWGQRQAKVQSWRATTNGLEGTAKAASHGVLLLDEMGQADDKTIGDAVYMLANEVGKARATRMGEARERASWRLIFLSTGEIGLEGKMNEANKKAATGLHVRLVDIPADAGSGLGAFQTLHGQPDPASLAKHLRRASDQFYGTPIREYLQRLTEHRATDEDELQSLLTSFREDFVRKYVPPEADGQVTSVASRFSLVAAAGELASAFGVTGWPADTASDAAGECFRAWLGSRGHFGAGEDEQALAAVRAFIVQHGSSRFEDVSGISPSSDSGTSMTTYQRVGWRVDRSTGNGWDYAIHPEAWKSEVCKGHDPSRAARVLKDRGLLVNPEINRLKSKVTIPGHGRPRLYVVSGTIIGCDDGPEDGGSSS